MIDDVEIARKLVNISRSANARKLDFNLNFKIVKRLMEAKKCFYTHVELTEIEGSPDKRTIDRVDNEKGYVIGNVVPCTKEFNEIKGNLTMSQVEQLVEGLKKMKLWKC